MNLALMAWAPESCRVRWVEWRGFLDAFHEIRIGLGHDSNGGDITETLTLLREPGVSRKGMCEHGSPLRRQVPHLALRETKAIHS